MATPDVPIAKWVGRPRSYTSGRKARQPSVIVIHTTDGSERPTSAEDGAAYDKTRTDGTSTHFFVDSTGVVQELEISDEAHAARAHGNDIGIQIEVCGLARQTAAQWADDASKKTLEWLAQLCVQLRRLGYYPTRRLSPAELRGSWNSGSPRGFCGHVDITNAFPEDKGTHTDPGPSFPWTWLFNRINELEDDSVNSADIDKIADLVIEKLTKPTALKGADGKPDGTESTLVGHHVLSQGIPNPFKGGKRTAAYELIGDIAEAVQASKTTGQ